jgi:hypothetical protein
MRDAGFRCQMPEIRSDMMSLLQTFLDIALWRKGPQDLPASRSLALATLLAYATAEFVKSSMVTDDAVRALSLIGIDLLMLTAWSWLVLSFFNRRRRFVQTFTATLGVGVMMLIVNIVIMLLYPPLTSRAELLFAWNFVWLIANALVVGRIFMHALDRSLMTGMALVVAIVYSTEAVAKLMLPRL